MNVLEKNCPECKATLIEDIQSGETVCSGCGLVTAEQVVNFGPETKSATAEEQMKHDRATGMTTYALHDLGISTEIASGTRDFSGKTINHQMANQMSSLRKWHQRVRVSTSKERRLTSVLSKMSDARKSLNLSKNVLETASMVYRNLDSRIDVKGKSTTGIAAAAIYMACKQCNVIRSMEEICRVMCAPKDVKVRAKLAGKYYRTMVMELGQSTAPVLTIDKYISKISNITQTDVRVERLALDLAAKTMDSSIVDGKAPNGIAAAYMYIASVLIGQNMLQRDVSNVSGITEVTIRNRCKEILGKYSLRIVLKPSRAMQ